MLSQPGSTATQQDSCRTPARVSVGKSTGEGRVQDQLLRSCVLAGMTCLSPQILQTSMMGLVGLILRSQPCMRYFRF